MSMTDPIADMFTRIRNAHGVNKSRVAMPASKLKASVADVLKEEGFIKGYDIIDENGKPELSVHLKYFQGEPVIETIQRASRPGLRVYRGKSDIPKVMGGYGIAILSTNKGLMSGKKAAELGVGGEIIGYVS